MQARRQHGAIDTQMPGLIFAILLAIAWYNFWYKYAPANGWAPGWSVGKVVSLLVPLVIAVLALALGNPGHGMATLGAMERERREREAAAGEPKKDL